VPDEQPHTFTCDVCKRTVETYDSEEEMKAEAIALYGEWPEPEDRASLCDDCHERFLVWARKKGLVQ
jgi:uncharacterized protein YlaI